MTHSLAAMAAGAVALAAAHAGPASLASSPAHRLLRIHRRLRDPARVALTFDDGPQPEALAALLPLLEREGVRATFFLVGERAGRAPALVKEIAAAGHEIGSHGQTHSNDLFRSPFAAWRNIARGAAAVAAIVGHRPELYRPPYGVVALGTRLGAWRAGQRLVLWSRWGRDWRRDATPESIVRRAASGVRGGDIVLLHDAEYYAAEGTWRKTLAALPRILDCIRSRGLIPSPIGGPRALA